MPVVGLEAEFTLLVNGQPQRPEAYFGTPRALVQAAFAPDAANEKTASAKIIPRVGKSCHLPSGGALYFDTGVIEVATGLIELDGPLGVRRAVRSLWEQIAAVRRALDMWERRRGDSLRLQGFSAHYNFSQHRANARRLALTARLLNFFLPIPTLLLAANRASTAVGVRPRPGRLEITADFTPDVALTTATLAFLAGVLDAVARWPLGDLRPERLATRGVPRLRGFRPSKHSSRKGWRAHVADFSQNPFTTDPAAVEWRLQDGRTLSLRALASEVCAAFAPAVRRFADEEIRAHIRDVLAGEARSLLDFDGRPPAYDDAGRRIDWGRRRSRPLPRSAYERAIRRVLSHRPLRLDGALWRVERMPGWYEFVFREVNTGVRRVFNLDQLAARSKRV